MVVTREEDVVYHKNLPLVKVYPYPPHLDAHNLYYLRKYNVPYNVFFFHITKTFAKEGI